MEVPNDDFSFEEWLSFDDGNLEETYRYWTPPNLENSHREESQFNHALPDAVDIKNLPPHYYLSSLGIDLFAKEPIDYITHVDPSGLDPGFETDSTTRSGSVDAWLTSTESVSADSLTSPETSSFSPDFLDSTSPAHLSSLQSSPTNMVQMSAKDITNIPPTRRIVVRESLTITPGAQSSPSETSTTHQPHQKRSSRTRLSKRERRRLEKPEKCTICNKGHQYKADLKKHIVAKHRDMAPLFELSTERNFCKWCPKSFARKDHLLRHLTRKHSRDPNEGRSRKQNTA
ncbi:Zinc finger and BTB domain-containing protein 7C [Madurella mycetomatis]|uniref:Zinc finger and BTB domain-containing protein 7C n=1 Tax=Madurella mycetomatis TaxID=100816 RepID=A0A175VYM1_9PEZI|nr:Zinc finger and BTB domain-containing protein 7C [Madurella mycetomatis]